MEYRGHNESDEYAQAFLSHLDGDNKPWALSGLFQSAVSVLGNALPGSNVLFALKTLAEIAQLREDGGAPNPKLKLRVRGSQPKPPKKIPNGDTAPEETPEGEKGGEDDEGGSSDDEDENDGEFIDPGDKPFSSLLESVLQKAGLQDSAYDQNLLQYLCEVCKSHEVVAGTNGFGDVAQTVASFCSGGNPFFSAVSQLFLAN